ncbi:ABC transporter permease subunit [Bacillus sp. H-16]|uniref:ABC transporter permease n=1 Tax=Alteribacter salitolerans TaxID=2912333 RepID=UPI0019627B7D|nr:ABC transporter permease [Alteribacter salitolerans]MBM7094337.1 ABC transporter permease subunit [Alteribacter salitolerans]
MMMIRLIQNEWMKIRRRRGTKVMVFLLLAFVILGAVMTSFLLADENTSSSENWQDQLAAENRIIEEQLTEENLPPGTQYQLQETLMKNEYHLEHEVAPLPGDHAYSLVIDHAMLTSIVTVFAVIIGAGIVSGEHSTGTIKLLLVRPVRRWRILLSKWAATLLTALLMTAILLLSTLITGLFVFGFDFTPVRHVEVINGEIRDWHVISYILSAYSLQFVELIMIAAMAFMIGTVFRNQALAVGVSLVAMFMGGQVVYLLSGYEWAKYILFANSRLVQFLDGAPLIPSLTAGFSVTMLILYFTAFMLLTFVVFMKRDVAD